MLHARGSVQLGLIALLHTKLADVFRAPVICLVFAFIDLFFFRLIDAPNVANHMAGQLPIGIVAKQTGFDFHPWKTKPLGSKPCHLGVRQSGPNRQRLKILGLFHQFLEAPPITWRDVHHFGKVIDRLLQRGALARRNFQGVCGVITGQNNAIAIYDQATIGDDRND